MLRQGLQGAVCVVVALAIAGGASAQPARSGLHHKRGWRIYRVSKTRWIETVHMAQISVQGTVFDCAVDVTTTGSTGTYYIGTAQHFRYIVAAKTKAGVPKAPVPARFSVHGHLSISIGHTKCADGSPPPVDCAGTYSFPLFVAQFGLAGHTDWVFSYHPTTPAGSVAAELPASCHPDDPTYSDVPLHAFDLIATGGYGPPYTNPMELTINRKRLLAGKSFTAKSHQSYDGPTTDGTTLSESLNTRASLIRVR
jgi:hypothetical protein